MASTLHPSGIVEQAQNHLENPLLDWLAEWQPYEALNSHSKSSMHTTIKKRGMSKASIPPVSPALFIDDQQQFQLNSPFLDWLSERRQYESSSATTKQLSRYLNKKRRKKEGWKAAVRSGLPTPPVVEQQETQQEDPFLQWLHERQPGSPDLMQTPTYLLQLPQELQDTIFDYAYPRERRKYVNRTFWGYDEREYEKRRGQYTKRPFSTAAAKVSSFLVSKRFFVQAARAWVANQDFEPTFNRVRTFGDALGLSGILLENVREVRLDWNDRDLQELGKLPSLRKVTVTVKAAAFSKLAGDRNAWSQDLDEDDIRLVVGATMLSELQGLLEFNTVSRSPSRGRYMMYYDSDESDDSDDDDEVERRFKANVRRLGDYLRPMVTQPRDPEEDPRYIPNSSRYMRSYWAGKARKLKHERLYTGSLVSFGTSNLYIPEFDESSICEEDAAELQDRLVDSRQEDDASVMQKGAVAKEKNAPATCDCPECQPWRSMRDDEIPENRAILGNRLKWGDDGDKIAEWVHKAKLRPRHWFTVTLGLMLEGRVGDLRTLATERVQEVFEQAMRWVAQSSP